MKNSETNGNKYIFDNTDSDCNNNNLNLTNSEYDKNSDYSVTKNNNKHRSKRLIISRRSSKKKIPQINKDDLLNNEEILKTEFPNQKIIMPILKREQEIDPKIISFTKNKSENDLNSNKVHKNSIYNTDKIILGKTILDTHRSNLIEIVNNDSSKNQNKILLNNKAYSSLKEKSNENINTGNFKSNNINIELNSKYNNTTLYENEDDKVLNKKYNKINNIINKATEYNIDVENYYHCYEEHDMNDQINNSSIIENIQNKSATDESDNKTKKNSINIKTKTSEKLQKKNYQDTLKQSLDYFPNYTTISKSKII